jgi:hypothetical protein
MAGGGVGEAALASEIIGAEVAATTLGGAELGTGIAALEGAGALAPAVTEAGAGLGALNTTPLTQMSAGEIAGAVNAGVNPAVYGAGTQLAGPMVPGAINTGATPLYLGAESAGGVSSGLPFTTGGADVAAQQTAAQQAAVQSAAAQPAAQDLTMKQLLHAGEGAGETWALAPDKVPAAASGMLDKFGTWYDSLSGLQKMGLGLGASMAAQTLMGKDKDTGQPTSTYSGPLSKFKYDPSKYTPLTTPQPTPYRAAYHAYAAGGPVEQMSDQNAIGANTGYPMADINNAAYATPYQQPISRNVLTGDQDVRVDPYTGEQRFADGGLAALAGRRGAPAPTTYGLTPALAMFRNLQAQRAAAPQMPSRPAPIDTYADYANQMAANRAALSRPAQAAIPVNPAAFSNYNTPAPAAPEMTGGKSYEGLAGGGLASLGSYSDGGRMLKGPGDGMSDDIPATIAGKQPALLANDEFVVPADVVSHLGNGSSDAGAKQLYKMMDRVRSARTGTKKQGKQINPDKYMPA